MYHVRGVYFKVKGVRKNLQSISGSADISKYLVHIGGVFTCGVNAFLERFFAVSSVCTSNIFQLQKFVTPKKIFRRIIGGGKFASRHDAYISDPYIIARKRNAPLLSTPVFVDLQQQLNAVEQRDVCCLMSQDPPMSPYSVPKLYISLLINVSEKINNIVSKVDSPN